MGNKENVQSWRARTKDRMVESMGGKCQCCGYDKCDAAMEFHHLDMNEKEFGFSAALKNPSSWSKIAVELRKCVLLCANCHREIHHGTLELPSSIKGFNEDYSDYLQKQKEDLLDNCPICGKKKSKHLITCSLTCAGKKARKIDWDSIDVYSLINTHGNAEQAGKALGISGAAVRKRVKKLSKSNTLAAKPN